MALAAKFDMNNRSLAIATAVGVTIVTGAGLYYMKLRNQQKLETEKKVERIVSHCIFTAIIFVDLSPKTAFLKILLFFRI